MRLSGVVGLDLVASEIVKLPEVATRQYRPGERLGGDTSERLKRWHVYICDGAIGLWMAVAGSTSALLEVCGPGRVLPPRLWETEMERRYAAALVPTTTLELPAAVFERHVAAHPPLARSLASCNAYGFGTTLDRLAMLALRDPLPRVARALLLLLERLSAAPSATPGARLAVGQNLIAAFASLSRQTTNRQLRRLAHAGMTTSRRGAVDVRDPPALRDVAMGRPLAP